MHRSLTALLFLSFATWATNATAKQPIVIVHGAWGGSHHWIQVAEAMESRSEHVVHRIQLSGLGSRQHLLSRDITLSTHIDDVVGHIDFENLHDVVLIAHSYGGVVASGVLDQIPERIARVIYLDAHLLDDGESYLTHHPKKLAQWKTLAAERGDGYFLPVTWPNETVRDAPHPIATLLTPIRLSTKIPDSIRQHYWLFADGKPADMDERHRYLQRARERGFMTRVMEWNHNPQREVPDAVARELLLTIDTPNQP